MDCELRSVLISDDVDQECIEILQRNGISAVKNTKLTTEQLKKEISKYDGLVVRSATKVTSEIIEAGSRLKIIGRAGTGVDNVDVPAATRRGIVVMNTPGGNTLSAAEHTCAMLMAVSRHVARGDAAVRAGRWQDKKNLVGNELYGKTLGIVGLGRIGREVALRMQAFGMKTVGYDPILRAEETLEFGVELVSLDELWPLVDYITLHTPLIPQTRHLIGVETLAKCRRGVRIVNCARGGIIDEAALLDALESGHCAGAGIDVFEQEPPTNAALLQHPLVTCTPHLGASTVEAQSRVAAEIAQQFVEFSRQTKMVGVVNAPVLGLCTGAETRSWMILAGAIAKVAGHLVDGPVRKDTRITLKVRGGEGVLSDDVMNDALSAAVLVKLLPSSPLNLVNAPAYAKSVSIKVKVVREPVTPRSDSIRQAEPPTLTLSVHRCPEVEQTPSGALTSVEVVASLADGVQPYWTAVDGAIFWRPVRLAGHLVACCSSGSTQTAAALTASIGDAVGSDAAVVSLTCAKPTSDGAATWWCVVELSAAVGTIKVPSLRLVKQLDF